MDSDGAIQVSQNDPGLAEAMAGAQIDRLVEVANRYPRSITAFRDQLQEMATYDMDAAAGCKYALPRGGKSIVGPSVKFAQLVASCWGNLWIQVTPVHQDKRFVTVRSVCWDVEKNLCIAFDVKRRITTTAGITFNDDMIQTTTAAAASIAYRNAVLRIVPEAFTRPALDAAAQVVRGDASTLQERRDKMFAHFAAMGVDEQRILVAVGVEDREGIGLDELEVLFGIANGIKNDGMDIDSAFPNVTREGEAVKRSGGSGVSALKSKLSESKPAVSGSDSSAPGSDSGEPEGEEEGPSGSEDEIDADVDAALSGAKPVSKKATAKKKSAVGSGSEGESVSESDGSVDSDQDS